VAYEETTLPSSKVKIKWKEKYVSDAIARYAYGNQNLGVAKGFAIEPDGDQIIRLAHDPGDDDSVAIVANEPYDRGFVVVEPTENTFDLQDESGSTVHVWLHVFYQIEDDTILSVRVSDSDSGESWMDSATYLGSVDVPSGDPSLNPIEKDDINLYDTEFVGIDSTISGTKWNRINSNTKFQRRLTGYEITGDEDYVSYDGVSQAAELGTTVDSQGGNTASLSFGDGDLEQGDDILIRVKGATNDLEDDAKLLIEDPDQTFEITSGLDGANQTEFTRGIRFQAGDLSSGRIKLTLDLSNTSTTTGEVFIDQFEVYTHQFPRKVGTIESKERYDLINQQENVDGNDRVSVEHVDYSMAFTDMGASLIKLSEWNAYEDLPVKTNIDSILEGIMHGSKGAGVVDEVYPARVVSGLFVEKSGSSKVDIDTGVYTADASRKQARLEDVPAYTDVTVTTDGGTYYIVADPEEDPGNPSFIKQVDADIYDVEVNNYLPLAWMETSSSEITKLLDARDLLPSESHSDSVNVGRLTGTVNFTPDHRRFSSLEYVFNLLSHQNSTFADNAWRGSREVEIVDDITISRGNLDIPDNCTLTSDGQRNIHVQFIDGNPLFRLAGENIEIENLNFTGDDNTTFGSEIGQVTLFEFNGDVRNVHFKNVNALSDGDSGFAFTKGIFSAGQTITGQMSVKDCEIRTVDEAVEVSTDNGNCQVSIKDCKFGSFTNFGSVNTKGPHLRVDMQDNANACVSGVKVGFTEGAAQGVLIDKAQLTNADVYCPIRAEGDCTLSDITMDFDEVSQGADRSNPIEIAGSRTKVEGVSIYNGSSETGDTAIEVNADDCILSGLHVDYRNGECLSINGDDVSVDGYYFKQSPVSAFPTCITIEGGASRVMLSDGKIVFQGEAGEGVSATSNGERLLIDGLINVNVNIPTNSVPRCLNTTVPKTSISGVKYEDPSPDATASAAAFTVNADDFSAEKCELYVPDRAVEHLGGDRARYSDISVYVQSSNLSESNRIIFDIESATNVQIESVMQYGTWDGSSIIVLPFRFDSNTSGVTIRDCGVEADDSNSDNDPQDATGVQEYVTEFGTSGSTPNKTLFLNGNAAMAEFELTALPPV
jgi:hypothetical protein